MIASYLLNMQTRRRKDFALEKKAEARDSGEVVMEEDENDDLENEDEGQESDSQSPKALPSASKPKPHPRVSFLDSDDDELPADPLSNDGESRRTGAKVRLDSVDPYLCLY